jgi:hypothetical protein
VLINILDLLHDYEDHSKFDDEIVSHMLNHICENGLPSYIIIMFLSSLRIPCFRFQKQALKMVLSPAINAGMPQRHSS